MGAGGFARIVAQVILAPMLIRRRLITVAPLVVLAACASLADFRDGQPIATGRAPVLVHPRYGYGPGFPETVELTFTRVGAGKAEDVSTARVVNYDVSIVELPPGFYFLRRVRATIHANFSLAGAATDFEHTYEPKLIEVREGRINYPGDWVIPLARGASSTSGSVGFGSVSTEYRTAMWVEENKEAAVKLSKKYPLLNAKLPLRVTRLQGS
jgi:hypothetical protein